MFRATKNQPVNGLVYILQQAFPLLNVKEATDFGLWTGRLPFGFYMDLDNRFRMDLDWFWTDLDRWFLTDLDWFFLDIWILTLVCI